MPIIVDLIGMLDDVHALVARNATPETIEAVMRRLRAAILAAIGMTHPTRLQ